MRIDLHTHSTCSDGTQSPAALVADARPAGLDALALTDHDTMAGWASAAATATELGITLVPGVEISCECAGRSVHLLGYLVDPADGPLTAELARARDSRATRLARMVALLAPLPLLRHDRHASRWHRQRPAGARPPTRTPVLRWLPEPRGR